MARNEKKFFSCHDCGSDFPRWHGRCPACQAWNSLEEHVKNTTKSSSFTISEYISKPQPVSLADVDLSGDVRVSVGIEELDRVLGGGLVAGSAVLIGGDPGIGKSTLIMEALARLSKKLSVLYVSGEESARQIRLRGDRLKIAGDRFRLFPETGLESILQSIEQEKPAVLAIDSIQTTVSANIASASGTVSQVRTCATMLIETCKRNNIALFLVGHVTKEGQLAGPRVLEHMVDTVLYFEGERSHNYRILRAVKNRFGAANEIGVFEMRDCGLMQVHNPSELFLSERTAGVGGSTVFPCLEGTRPVLVEIQALVAPSPLSQPRRTTLGIDANRLAMLIAVLEKRVGFGLFDHDVFLNATGGLRVIEPASDLAVIAALFSSQRNCVVDPGWVIFGEVGLGGEVRGVVHAASRLKEAAKLGFTHALLPEKSLKSISAKAIGIIAIPVESVADCVERITQKTGC